MLFQGRQPWKNEKGLLSGGYRQQVLLFCLGIKGYCGSTDNFFLDNDVAGIYAEQKGRREECGYAYFDR